MTARFAELLPSLWPLLPLAGAWWGHRRPSARPFAVGGGVAAGLTGWVATGLGGGFGAAWLASAVALAAASLYALRRDEADTAATDASAESRAAQEKRLATLEKERDGLRREFEHFEREDTRAFQVYSLAKSLTETLSWEGLAARFTQVLQKVTGSAEFRLFLPGDAGGALELQLENGAWAREDVPAAAPGPLPQWLTRASGTVLQVPLWRGGELVGVLWVRWRDDAHPAVSEIGAIFENLTIGFQKARLFARMEALSRLDGLTGVLRRQTFLEHVRTEWTRARTFKTTFSFMLVDVDHFKAVNDAHGHPAGDAVLARMGEVLRQGVYETDFVGRYGGEEFGILLSRAEPEGVRRKAEAIRARVAAEPFAAGWEKLAVTISVGLAHYPRDGATVEEVLDAADRALYAAKRAGRDRVVDAADIR